MTANVDTRTPAERLLMETDNLHKRGNVTNTEQYENRKKWFSLRSEMYKDHTWDRTFNNLLTLVVRRNDPEMMSLMLEHCYVQLASACISAITTLGICDIKDTPFLTRDHLFDLNTKLAEHYKKSPARTGEDDVLSEFRQIEESADRPDRVISDYLNRQGVFAPKPKRTDHVQRHAHMAVRNAEEAIMDGTRPASATIPSEDEEEIRKIKIQIGDTKRLLGIEKSNAQRTGDYTVFAETQKKFDGLRQDLNTAKRAARARTIPHSEPVMTDSKTKLESEIAHLTSQVATEMGKEVLNEDLIMSLQDQLEQKEQELQRIMGPAEVDLHNQLEATITDCTIQIKEELNKGSARNRERIAELQQKRNAAQEHLQKLSAPAPTPVSVTVPVLDSIHTGVTNGGSHEQPVLAPTPVTVTPASPAPQPTPKSDVVATRGHQDFDLSAVATTVKDEESKIKTIVDAIKEKYGNHPKVAPILESLPSRGLVDLERFASQLDIKI